MAAPVTVDEFLDLVRKSGVADEKRLDAFLQENRALLPREPGQAAGVLVQNGLITSFQADSILAGKWKRFSIGKYKILEKLGGGGMAQVFLCEHKIMRRRVAVKVLPSERAKDAESLGRFYREARAVAALDHPNIVHAYDIDQDGDLHFLVMEYVDGSNLQDLVQKSGMLDVTRACHYIRQSSLALQHAHEAGLVHRDIKPGNILVDRGGVVKVLDMGLARFFHDKDDMLTKKHNGNVLGTADYLAPEQALDSHAADIRADIYSLGATFYFMLTGHAPFESANEAQKLMMHQFQQPKPISDYRKDVSAAVAAIVQKMMAKQPDQRYTTPGELADALAVFTRQAIAAPAEAEMPCLSAAASARVAAIQPPAVPNPAPLQAEAVVSQADSEAWEKFAAEQSSANADNTKFKGQGSSMPLVIGLVGLLLLSTCITSAAGLAYWFYRSPEPTPQDPSLPTLAVSKDAKGPNVYRTIQLALREAKIGSIIELRDEIHEENVVIEPIHGRTNVTIQAAPHRTVLWRGKSDPDTPLIKAHKAKQFKLNGAGITLDGGADPKRRVNKLIMITGDSPGLTIEDLHLQNFASSAVLIMNATGVSDKPIVLRRLSITTEKTEKTRAAIFLDANPDMTPAIIEHIDISDCHFRGIDLKDAIQSGNPKALGAGVTWPGR